MIPSADPDQCVLVWGLLLQLGFVLFVQFVLLIVLRCLAIWRGLGARFTRFDGISVHVGFDRQFGMDTPPPSIC